MILKKVCRYGLTAIFSLTLYKSALFAQVAPIVPAIEQLNRKFSDQDKAAFKSPDKVYYPETWFHFIGGNVSKEGITKDLEAIAKSGISGIQLFHGQFGGPWPGVEPQITCLSPLWEDAVKHTAAECKRLGLKFTMQNCPGWAMAGGPWIKPENAMRHLAWSRTDVKGGKVNIHLDQPQPSKEDWRDYRDITVLAFPTPAEDTGKPIIPASAQGSGDIKWSDLLTSDKEKPVRLKPATIDQPYWAEVNFDGPSTIRTIELPSVNSMSHAWNYEPGVKIRVQATTADGQTKEILNTLVPAANFQDGQPVTLACPEVKAKSLKIWIKNKHDMQLRYIRFYSAARKNNWEAEAGWTLRDIDRSGTAYAQSKQSYIDPAKIKDITGFMNKNGDLKWDAPAGNWTVLRVGHVNSGKQNGPAPKEGTGWECNKLSESGADAHFAGYIGRLSATNGVLGGGLLSGMLMDSWECETQTWTADMEAEFARVSSYPLRKWLPAIFGYVMNDQETTFRFLHDWRYTINDLYTNKFYGRMAKLAKQNGLAVSYETAAGDVFPADIMEYYKFADVPMCEFWQPFNNSGGFVGSLNFKPVKPAASAARLYGKPRLGSEAFTSFELTWDEQWPMLKEVANVNTVEGVTHLIYHTYTHNPLADRMRPGTSFGSNIGTPFLRGQTWWPHMPAFNSYFARLSYMLERGKPVSDVLWYLGDEIGHKPDQNAPFPEGFKYDYCNPDVLLHRLSVVNGMLTTPEGIQYKVLWLPETTHMLPQTLEKLNQLINAGATVVGNAPKSIVTLSGGSVAQLRFAATVKKIWGNGKAKGVRSMGKGTIISGTSLQDALSALKLSPDVTGGSALWSHRKIDGADWYFITAAKGKGFKGTLDIRNTGNAELWDPVTGNTEPLAATTKDGRSSIQLDLPQAGSCFVVFRHDKPFIAVKPVKEVVSTIAFSKPWDISFPDGWGASGSVRTDILKPWKELDMPAEAKAFSGTATYTDHFMVDRVNKTEKTFLDLGDVSMIAKVIFNGKDVGTVWCAPYRVDISGAITPGENTVKIEVTSTWFNRLVYDAGQPEANRKSWTISGPSKDAALRNSGLLGPVTLVTK